MPSSSHVGLTHGTYPRTCDMDGNSKERRWARRKHNVYPANGTPEGRWRFRIMLSIMYVLTCKAYSTIFYVRSEDVVLLHTVAPLQNCAPSRGSWGNVVQVGVLCSVVHLAADPLLRPLVLSVLARYSSRPTSFTRSRLLPKRNTGGQKVGTPIHAPPRRFDSNPHIWGGRYRSPALTFPPASTRRPIDSEAMAMGRACRVPNHRFIYPHWYYAPRSGQHLTLWRPPRSRSLSATGWHGSTASAAHFCSRRFLSLRELAQAFSDIGGEELLSRKSAMGSRQHPHCGGTGQQQQQQTVVGTPAPPSGARDASSCFPCTLTSGGGVDDSSARHEQEAPSRAASIPSLSSPPPLPLSPTYAVFLESCDANALASEVSTAVKRLHYGTMLQTLMEVHRRWTTLCASHGSRHGSAVPSPFYIPPEEAVVGGRSRGGPGWGLTPTTDATNPAATASFWGRTVPPPSAWGSAHGASAVVNRDVEAVSREPLLPSTAAEPGFRSDALLLQCLRCLTKVDLAHFEADIQRLLRPSVGETPQHENRWPHGGRIGEAVTSGLDVCISAAAGDRRRFAVAPPVNAAQFIHELATYIRQWLCIRVSALDIHESVIVMHLLAQQALFVDEGILRTLVDTITLRADALALSETSLLLDALTRCQSGTINMLRWQMNILDSIATASTRTPGGDALPQAPPTSCKSPYQSAYVSTSVRTAAGHKYGRRSGFVGSQLPEALDACQHPVANKFFYSTIAEALIRVLGDEDRTPSAVVDRGGRRQGTGGRPWSSLTPATFLFLARSLAKLSFFHAGLPAAMQPGLADFLRQRPEHYYTVTLLYGRSENRYGDAEVLLATVDALRVLLDRRGSVFQDASGGPSPNPPHSDGAGRGLHDREDRDAIMMHSAEEDIDDLLSAHGDDNRVAGGGGGADGLASNRGAVAPRHDRFSRQRISFLDPQTFPVYLQRLMHHYGLVVPHLSAATRHTLAGTRKRVQLVYRLLLDDMQQGLPVETLTLSALDQFLTEIGSAHRVLYCDEDNTATRPLPESRTGSASRDGDLHPFLVELAYAWTRAVSRRYPPSSPKHRPPVVWAKQARGILLTLLFLRVFEVLEVPVRNSTLSSSHTRRRHGRPSAPAPRQEGVERRYVIAPEALAVAPRVAAWIEQERLLIYREAVEKQAQSDAKTPTPKGLQVRPTAVFRVFSHVMDAVRADG